LNRQNEGIAIPTPISSLTKVKKAAPSTPLPTRELNRAVRLTRDAVYAWVNVFTGPALVTASQ
jgi:hypothetical protein